MNENIIKLGENNIFQKKETSTFLLIDDLIGNNPIKRSQWVRDELVNSCTICGSPFNIFNRRHHCRCCGKIFCYICTNYQIKIPNLNTNININIDIPEKVCSLCYKRVSDFKQLEKMYIILGKLPINLLELKNICLVSKTWNKIIKYHIYNFQKILNKSFSENYTRDEINFLKINYRLFIGHSCWLIHIIKLCNLGYFNIDNQFDIFKSEKKIPCNILKCNWECYSKIRPENAILCLSLENIPYSIQTILIDIISKCNYRELICYLPLFVNSLPVRNHNNLLINFLVELSKKHYEFANQLFWEITVQMESSRYQSLYESLRNKLTEQLNDTFKEELKNAFYFVENLKDLVVSNENKKFTVLFKSYFNILKESNIHFIRSPLNTHIKLIDVNINNIKVKESSSRPIIIPFKTVNNNSDENQYKLLYKSEDVRKDLIIMNIIKLVDIILKREEGLNLHITTYNILPTSSNSGFIEIINDAETIYSINRNKKFSILNFILEHNTDVPIDKIRMRFTKSCVAYCILSYILGIGDRHLENIMVKTTGEIFHIDFGFILGMDPKPMAPEIRITDEMVDAMGGYESKYYKYFKETCAKAFICLRRHVSIFKSIFNSFITLEPKIDKKFTREYISTFIDNKFLVGENLNQVTLYLINKITTRTHKYSESLIDFCHDAGINNKRMTDNLYGLNSIGKSIAKYFY